MVADVPVGAFLSGGVDSSALVGLMAEVLPGPVRTVTLSLDVPELDESRLAGVAAALYRTDHHDVPIRIEEVRERVADAVRALDQPSIDGINTFFVSEAAAKTGLKVAVSGVGGDELFGGYPSFERVPRIRRLHARLSRWPGGSRSRPLGRALARARVSGACGARSSRARWRSGGDDAGAYFAERGLFAPAEVRALLAPELGGGDRRLRPASPSCARRVRPDELRRGRARLRARVPPVPPDAAPARHRCDGDAPLARGPHAARRPRAAARRRAGCPPPLRRAGPAKQQLREAPRPPVPAALWQRRKQGFTLPFDRWLRQGSLLDGSPSTPGCAPRRSRLRRAGFRAARVHWSRVWALHVLAHFLS